MKWFKHCSDAHSHPKIQRLIQEFGSDGYYVCFRTFEIICRFGDKYLRLPFKKYSKSAIALDFRLPQDRIEMVWTCMIDENLLDVRSYKRGILYSKKLKEYVPFYAKIVKSVKSNLKPAASDLQETAALRGSDVEVDVDVDVEEDKGSTTPAEKTAAAIQKIIGNEIKLNTIASLVKDRDPKEMLALARKAKQNAKNNVAGYFRKLVTENTKPIVQSCAMTGDFWLDITPDRVLELVKQKVPDFKVKETLIEIHDHYNAQYLPAEFHKWKHKMDDIEVENMLEVAKEILNKRS